MAALFRYISDSYTYIMDDLSDPRVNAFPLMTSPWPTIGILLFYNYFVQSLGPELMKNRKPFDVKYPMIFYNLVQIVFNGFFVEESLRLLWIPGEYSLFCAEVDYSNDPLAVKVAFYVWLFYVTKLLDLFDTFFMVLRKKENQVSFLHIYHHTGMVAAGWFGTKFVGGGHPIFFGTLNAFVHVIMYSYYLITALYPQYKNNIWWKRHITELQLVQFVVAGLHGVIGLVHPTCNFPKFLIFLFLPQDVFMFVMFWDFYRKAYLTKKTDGKGSEIPQSTNDDAVTSKSKSN